VFFSPLGKQEQFNSHIPTMNINRSKRGRVVFLQACSELTAGLRKQSGVNLCCSGGLIVKGRSFCLIQNSELCLEIKSQLSDKLQEQQLVTLNFRLNMQSTSQM